MGVRQARTITTYKEHMGCWVDVTNIIIMFSPESSYFNKVVTPVLGLWKVRDFP